MVVFRGHYFWLLDQHRVPGPARPITPAWGVPSPIDTAFTRCNCQGKTYIFKPAVSISISWKGFPSSITAAASVPSASTPDGYKYYVFSRSQSFSVRMDSGRPAVPKARNNAPPRSHDFFKCSARA
ncbi:Proteoglycan 4 [Liparis tanakae]|uniref:Proteoglycan 4 n=1 Tax=Liparis tanakae TaxID=230148 RepID=A0A4Z2F580_9TELE|nr:Proteoglycan 4 [Liparis tanakae]